jgi:hypothetical protein
VDELTEEEKVWAFGEWARGVPTGALVSVAWARALGEALVERGDDRSFYGAAATPAAGGA